MREISIEFFISDSTKFSCERIWNFWLEFNDMGGWIGFKFVSLAFAMGFLYFWNENFPYLWNFPMQLLCEKLFVAEIFSPL